MSITKATLNEILKRIAEENSIKLSIIQNQISDIVQPDSPFASKAAKEYAEEKKVNIDEIEGSGKNGKISVDDIRLFLGEEPKHKKSPSQWSSKAAKDLAHENSLSSKDFPKSSRTGRVWKDGTVTISIEDVKTKLGISSPKKSPSKWSSKKAKELAEEYKLSSDDIKGTGKDNRITKSDVEKYIRKMKVESESESEAESEAESEDDAKSE